MNPPIRSERHREGLWRAFNDGIFDVFGSDHAPHTLDEKALEYPKSPSGMPGVQTMLPVLLTFVSKGLMTMKDVVLMACERPAKLYGMKGKGFLEVGMDADLVLVNRGARYTFERSMVQSKCGWSPFEGENFIGAVETVLVNGKIALREGERLGSPIGSQLEFEG
jgi:dihydroorotase